MVTSRICGANDDHSDGLVNRPQTVSGREIPLASTNMLSSLTDPTNQCSLRISATCSARPKRRCDALVAADAGERSRPQRRQVRTFLSRIVGAPFHRWSRVQGRSSVTVMNPPPQAVAARWVGPRWLRLVVGVVLVLLGASLVLKPFASLAVLVVLLVRPSSWPE